MCVRCAIDISPMISFKCMTKEDSKNIPKINVFEIVGCYIIDILISNII